MWLGNSCAESFDVRNVVESSGRVVCGVRQIIHHDHHQIWEVSSLPGGGP